MGQNTGEQVRRLFLTEIHVIKQERLETGNAQTDSSMYGQRDGCVMCSKWAESRIVWKGFQTKFQRIFTPSSLPVIPKFTPSSSFSRKASFLSSPWAISFRMTAIFIIYLVHVYFIITFISVIKVTFFQSNAIPLFFCVPPLMECHSARLTEDNGSTFTVWM